MNNLKCTPLSIEAWRECEGGWRWNAWYRMGEDLVIDNGRDTKPRRLLALLRDLGYLSDDSKGQLTVEDDGYNLMVKLRGTDEPVLALDYGSHWEANGL